MINNLYEIINHNISNIKNNKKNDIDIEEIHKNRVKNEIEQLKLNQCKISFCKELKNNEDIKGCHFHVNNIIMYDKINRKNYILLEITIIIAEIKSFYNNEIPIEIILYKDFPFSFPDIIFPNTFCFPSLSDGRSFTAEILNNEWSPSTTLLNVVDNIHAFLLNYNNHISTIGTSDLLIGSYRSPISFNYRCSNSLIYPILNIKIRFEDQVYDEIFNKELNLNNKRIISQKSRNFFTSLIPIPLNTKGLRRETMNWKLEKPYINIEFIFNNTNIMLFDSTLLIIESNYKNCINNNDNNPKISSSSDEILSDSILQGYIALWLFLSCISHIIDCNGNIIYGNKGTVPSYIMNKLNRLEYNECVVIILGYDILFEKSCMALLYNNDLIQIPKETTRPIIIELKFHNNKAKHENSCCYSFATNIRDKILKLDGNFPDNCHNPDWDSHFERNYLYNLNKRYQDVIISNHIYLNSDIIYRWVVTCSKLIEQTSFLSETDEKYIQESASLIKQMQTILISPVVNSMLDSDHNKKITSSIINQDNTDLFYDDTHDSNVTKDPNISNNTNIGEDLLNNNCELDNNKFDNIENNHYIKIYGSSSEYNSSNDEKNIIEDKS